MIIANPLGLIVDEIFDTPVSQMSTGVLWLGATAFFFQIYFDFSAYSDMAIGLGRMLGFHFMENFNYPYASKSIKEFWRRWHISLSTWFRDYLYIPLGGNRGTALRTGFNLLLVFILCGLWHGASWNFIVWGAYHGFFLMVERSAFGPLLARAWRPLQHIYVFLVVLVGWVIFRSSDMDYARQYLAGMAGIHHGTETYYFSQMFLSLENLYVAALSVLFSVPVFLWIKRMADASTSFLFAYMGGLLLILLISMSYVSSSTYNPFIYFQF